MTIKLTSITCIKLDGIQTKHLQEPMDIRVESGARPVKDRKSFCSLWLDLRRDEDGKGAAGDEKRRERMRGVGIEGMADRSEAMLHGEMESAGEDEEAIAIGMRGGSPCARARMDKGIEE